MLDPLELIERLVALIPPPRANLIRYHGVLAPCAGYRDAVVPVPPIAPLPDPTPGADPNDPATPGRGRGGPALGADSADAPSVAGRAATPLVEALVPDLTHPASAPTGAVSFLFPRPDRRRLSWADLMRRVFAIDVGLAPTSEYVAFV